VLKDEYKSLSDEELACLSQAGSLSAFEELVHRYESRVFGFLVKCCHCEADAGDIAQNTFITAFRSVGQFDSKRSFSAWLFAIARNKFLDHLRRQRPSTDQIPESADWCDPSMEMARNEQGKDVWELARRHLSDDQFQALWLHYQEELSLREVATALGRNVIAVKVLVFRARRQLLRVYKKLGSAEFESVSALETVKTIQSR
jgi:RNA polymerase sigma-70 factor (ECF subfamily)